MMGYFPLFLSVCLNPVGSSPANQMFPAVLWQELMPWDHPYLSGILRAERWAFTVLHNFFFFASCHLITASWSGPCRFIMSRRTERRCDSRLVSAGPVGAQLFFQIQDSTARCVASFPLVFVFLSCMLLAYFNVVTAVIFCIVFKIIPEMWNN